MLDVSCTSIKRRIKRILLIYKLLCIKLQFLINILTLLIFYTPERGHRVPPLKENMKYGLIFYINGVPLQEPY